MAFEVGDFSGYWHAFSQNLNGPQPAFLGTLDNLLSDCFEQLEPEGRISEVKMFSAAFAGIRTASMMALGGSAMHVPATLRTSLEAAAYGALFGDKGEWYEIWSNRHEDIKAKNRFRKEGLKEAKKSIEKLGVGFNSNFESLYQMLIDMGAHPNVLGIDVFVDVTALDHQSDYYAFHHLSTNSERQLAFFTIGQVSLFLLNVIANSWKSKLKTRDNAKRVMNLLAQLDEFESTIEGTKES